jgi:hypothetical protein
MAVSTVHYLYQVILPDGSVIGELDDCTPQAGHSFLTGMASGHIDPLFTAVQSAKPDVQFRARQIGTLLSSLGLDGLNTQANPLDLLYRQGANLGSRQALASAVHKRIRVTNGLAYWTGIRASFQTPAEISVRVKPTYDGTNLPLIPAGTLALGNNPAAAEFYRLSAVYVNGVAATGVTGWSLEQGQRMDEIGADDDLYDTYCGISEIQPMLTLDALTWDTWTTFGMAGTAVTSWAVYLRKKFPDGSDYAPNTNNHIKLSGSAGIVVPNSTRGGGNSPTSTGLRIALHSTSGTTRPITITLNTTIP